MSDSGIVYRVCSKGGCRVRIPKASLDPHTLCVNCMGRICTFEDRCDECLILDDKEWKELDRYVRKLERDRIRRTKSSLSRSSTSQEVVDNPIVPSPAPSQGHLVEVSAPDPVSESGAKDSTFAGIQAVLEKMGQQIASLTEQGNRTWTVVSALSAGTKVSVSEKLSVSASVVEDASDRSCRAPRPRPLTSSRTHGRRKVESLREARGSSIRSGVPSSKPIDASQVASDNRRKGLSSVFGSSSDDVSSRRGWRHSTSSRPLKRKLLRDSEVSSEEQLLGCSHWSSPERFSSSEASPAKQSRAALSMNAPLPPSTWEELPRKLPTERPQEVLDRSSPPAAVRAGESDELPSTSRGNEAKDMLQGMQQQLSALMEKLQEPKRQHDAPGFMKTSQSVSAKKSADKHDASDTLGRDASERDASAHRSKERDASTRRNKERDASACERDVRDANARKHDAPVDHGVKERIETRGEADDVPALALPTSSDVERDRERPSEMLEVVSEEETKEQVPPSDYKTLMLLFQELFETDFKPAAPRSPRLSSFVEGCRIRLLLRGWSFPFQPRKLSRG
ncbi:uncharacterized protein LOC135222355 [Macrobrachium nipponense]|uniref:uncharacterized protein LOC135222355 n=1 Tax=Macrobrachium nipponense TaxID=159736 RepID=UPI0030C83918